MSSDKLDKKIIEAAENHHPSYDEMGWQNMEKLLDKHLPQEKERKRRFIFIILFFLLLGGAGIWYFFGYNKESKTDISNSILVNSTEKEKSESNNNVNIEATIEKETSSQPISDIAIPQIENITAAKTNTWSHIILDKKKFNSKNVQAKKPSQQVKKEYVVESKIDAESKPTTSEINIEKNADSKIASVNQESENISTEKKENVDNSKVEDATTINKEIQDDKNNPEEVAVKIKKEKPKSKKNSYLFLTLTAGPDLSFVSSGKSGTTKILGGAGVGYAMKNGLTFRTGFYSGRKVYSASPDSYNPPPGFTQYYPILENVDADCKVYEIPVSVSYSFGKSEKQNWFAGAGLSTLLMKNEKYTYTYKYYPSGPTYKSDWTLNNENKHYFSVLTLSGGYQRQLSKTVSLIAEPYLKVPLQGIGYGKVKLNSAGVMFTISVKPFNKK